MSRPPRGRMIFYRMVRDHRRRSHPRGESLIVLLDCGHVEHRHGGRKTPRLVLCTMCEAIAMMTSCSDCHKPGHTDDYGRKTAPCPRYCKLCPEPVTLISMVTFSEKCIVNGKFVCPACGKSFSAQLTAEEILYHVK